MKFITVTDPEGKPVHIAVDAIVRIKSPVVGVHHSKASCVLDLANGSHQAVIEAVAGIEELICEVGGSFTRFPDA
jgi:hypothetical protein